MRHVKSKRFQKHYDALKPATKALANKNFALLRLNSKHPSLHFKRIKPGLWSVRVGLDYRALAVEGKDRFQWVWIGPHDEYTALIK